MVLKRCRKAVRRSDEEEEIGETWRTMGNYRGPKDADLRSLQLLHD